MVAAPDSTLTRPAQAFRSLLGQGEAILAHFAQAHRRLCEVPADDLVQLVALVEPAGQLLVIASALDLGDRGVGRGTNESVIEEERVLGGAVGLGPDEASTNE